MINEVVLEKLGLARNEARVYLALLRVGSATPGELAKKSNVHRANVYDCLQRLAEKGLVSHIIRSKKRFFEAAEPGRLLSVLNEKRQSITEKESLVKALLPELMALKSFSAKKQQITIYDGLEGIKAVFEDILKTKKVNHVLGAWKYPYILKYYLHHWHRRRVKARLLDKMLFKKSSSKRASEFLKFPYTQVRVLPGSFNSPMVINIYGEKIAFIIGVKDHPLAILIRDESIAKDFKNYFDALWNASEKVS